MVDQVSSCHRADESLNVTMFICIIIYRDFSSASTLDEDFVDTVFHSLNFHPTYVWLDRQGHPHVMFCLRNDYESDERLLRAELLAIVAVMLTRLRHPFFESHSIIPVSHNIINV
jgi:hypothetical protein